MVLSLVISHLDYANSLQYGLPKSNIKPMQCIQNLAAKLVLKRDNYSSSMDALKGLHWLLVKYRIMFKCYCICFKVVNKQAPKYFKICLSPERHLETLDQIQMLEQYLWKKEVGASHLVTEPLKSMA